MLTLRVIRAGLAVGTPVFNSLRERIHVASFCSNNGQKSREFLLVLFVVSSVTEAGEHSHGLIKLFSPQVGSFLVNARVDVKDQGFESSATKVVSRHSFHPLNKVSALVNIDCAGVVLRIGDFVNKKCLRRVTIEGSKEPSV